MRAGTVSGETLSYSYGYVNELTHLFSLSTVSSMCTSTALAHAGGINQTLNWCLTMYEVFTGFFQQFTL